MASRGYRGLRFARGSASVAAATALSISVHEYSTVHDDRGEELVSPPSAPHPRADRSQKRAGEWHEMGPVRVSILAGERGRTR